MPLVSAFKSSRSALAHGLGQKSWALAWIIRNPTRKRGTSNRCGGERHSHDLYDYSPIVVQLKPKDEHKMLK